MEDFRKVVSSQNLSQYFSQRLGIPTDEISIFIKDYMNMQVLYRSAIREISNRLEILDDEFQFRHKRNPIHNIQTRLKSPQSTIEKLGRRNLAPKIDIMKAELTDIAGVRVICPYLDDIYHVADLLCAQKGIEVLHADDYIKRPKPNGYRSLHIVVNVDVHLSDGMEQVPVEIQIRTIAMDFWASLEHDLRYKSDSSIDKDLSEHTLNELLECANDIAAVDQRMQKIHLHLEKGNEQYFSNTYTDLNKKTS